MSSMSTEYGKKEKEEKGREKRKGEKPMSFSKKKRWKNNESYFTLYYKLQ